jgi:hypothetical protein
MFIEQQIESYKDSLARADILAIGEEALTELTHSQALQVTEGVLREQVDEIVRRRLRVPSYRRWRVKHLQLRAAQVQPAHWGLTVSDPVVDLAELIQDQDPVLVIGAADGACALFLAARGALVHVCDPDVAAVYGLESRAVTEQLGASIECTVVQLERFEPFAWFIACVIETSTLANMTARNRAALIGRLKTTTPQGGRHAIMPWSDARLSRDAVRTLYGDWAIMASQVGHGARKARNAGFMAVRPLAGQKP